MPKYNLSQIENPVAYERATAERIRENARKGRGKRWLAEDATREALVAFLGTKLGAPGFLGKMAESLNEWGSLTDKQESAVRKIMAQATERKAHFAAEAAKSVWIGTIGKREVFALTLAAVKRIEFDEGEGFWLHMFRSGENRVVYKGKHLGLTVGTEYQIKATPAAHTEYEGGKQTRISRPVVQGA